MKISAEENELLKHYAEKHGTIKYDPNKHVTAKGLAKSIGVTTKWARELLNREVESGKLERQLTRDGSRTFYVYYRE